MMNLSKLSFLNSNIWAIRLTGGYSIQSYKYPHCGLWSKLGFDSEFCFAKHLFSILAPDTEMARRLAAISVPPLRTLFEAAVRFRVLLRKTSIFDSCARYRNCPPIGRNFCTPTELWVQVFSPKTGITQSDKPGLNWWTAFTAHHIFCPMMRF